MYHSIIAISHALSRSLTPNTQVGADHLEEGDVPHDAPVLDAAVHPTPVSDATTDTEEETVITSLKINNQDMGVYGAKMLATAIREMGTVKEVEFYQNGLEHRGTEVRSIIPPTLTSACEVRVS